jgi:site-specific DNA-methyltransferase (adenine-specific)
MSAHVLLRCDAAGCDAEIEGDLVTLYLGDAREIPQWFAVPGTDAILVTDPPYGMGYDSGMVKARSARPIIGDDTTGTRDAAIALWGPSRPAIMFGTWRAPRPAGCRQVIIWDKGEFPGMGDLQSAFGSSHEEIYLLGPRYARPKGVARRGSVIRTATCMGNPNGLVAETGHPTPKPVALMELLLATVPAHLVVVDPFAGSGSTLIAARNLGRRAIGCEIDPTYARIAADRLTQTAIQF